MRGFSKTDNYSISFKFWVLLIALRNRIAEWCEPHMVLRRGWVSQPVGVTLETMMDFYRSIFKIDIRVSISESRFTIGPDSNGIVLHVG